MLGWAGIYLLAVCSLVVVAELVYLCLRLGRVRRRWRAFEAVFAAEGTSIVLELARLEQAAQERRFLLAPVRRLLESPMVRLLLGVYRNR